MENDSSMINLPLPHKKYNKKIDKLVEMLHKRGDNIVHFIGSSEVESMFYLYLLKKYKSNCFIFDKHGDHPLGIKFNLNTSYTQGENFNNERHYHVVAEMLTRCISNESTTIIIIPITINYLHLDIADGHANVFIYRKDLNQLEHFEPQMTSEYNDVLLNVEIEKFIRIFNDKLMLINGGNPVIFVDAMQICPKRDGFKVGIQQLELFSDLLLVKDVEPKGYCLAWSMFFTELCLQNPEIPSSIILEQIFEKLDDLSLSDASNYLRYVIRGYAGFINDKISKYFSLFGGLDNFTIQKMKQLKPIDVTRFRIVIRELINYEMEITMNPNYINERHDIVKKKTLELIIKLGFKPKHAIRKVGDIIDDDDEVLTEKYNRFHNYSFSSPMSSASLSSSSTENDEELLKEMEDELMMMFNKGKGRKGTKTKITKKNKTNKSYPRKYQKKTRKIVTNKIQTKYNGKNK